MVKADRRPPLVVLPLGMALEVMRAAEDGRARTTVPHLIDDDGRENLHVTGDFAEALLPAG